MRRRAARRPPSRWRRPAPRRAATGGRSRRCPCRSSARRGSAPPRSAACGGSSPGARLRGARRSAALTRTAPASTRDPGRRLKAARAHLPAQTARAPRASDAPAWTVSRSRNPHLMCRHSVLARSGGGRVAPCLSASAGSQRRMSSKGGPAGSGSCPGAATCTACAASHAVHNKLRGTSAATAHIQGTPLP